MEDARYCVPTDRNPVLSDGGRQARRLRDIKFFDLGRKALRPYRPTIPLSHYLTIPLSY